MSLNNAINGPLPLSISNGGTGSTTFTTHGVLIGEGTSPLHSIVMSNGQLLVGSTGVDPVAASLTAGAGITITPGAGSITIASTGGVSFPITAAEGGTGLTSLTTHGILVGEGTSNVNPIVLSDGQLLVGSTGIDPVATTLTAGSGITITNAGGSITIASTGSVTFPITVPQGGTGQTTLTAHGILVGEGTGNVNSIILGNGQFLTGDPGLDPIATTLAAGSNLTIGIVPGTITVGLASQTPHGILVGEGVSALNPIVLTNGQLLIGSTGADPVATSLTAGSGITITPGAGSITIASTGGVTFPITVPQGGTGLTTLTSHGVLVGEGTSNVNPIVLTDGHLLIGSTGADPVSATLTAGTNIMITSTAGSITINATGIPSFPLSVPNGGTGSFNLTAHGILVGEGTSAVNPITLTNGQLLIGSTGLDPVATQILAGSGITVTNGAGSITIAATGAGSLPWTTEGDMLFYNASLPGPARLPVGTTNQVLTSNGVDPLWKSYLLDDGLTNVSLGTSSLPTSSTGNNNSALGKNSLQNNTSGSLCSSFGAGALNLNSSGSSNCAFGYIALNINATGSFNSVFGTNAGSLSTGSNNICAFGYNSLLVNNTAANSAFGSQSLSANTTGFSNCAFGFNALSSNDDGIANSAFGDGALAQNVSASGNSAFGDLALTSNVTGTSNNAFGANSLDSNTDGSNNNAFGNDSLGGNTLGTDNNAFGFQALQLNDTGTSNNSIGSNSLQSNSNGTDNNAFGFDTLQSNLTGQFNSAFGSGALNQNTIGSSNNAFGDVALFSNINGASNNAFGTSALFGNISGDNNNAFGTSALISNTIGVNNNAFGLNALESNIDGGNNNAFGLQSLIGNTSGSNNNAIGTQALENNLTGDDNNAIGVDCLALNSTASDNNGYGTGSLDNNTIGTANNAFGSGSLASNIDGSNNSAFGDAALAGNTIGGDGNSAFGSSAGGAQDLYDNCTFLGVFTDAGANSLTNACAVGANAIVNVSNALVLGSGCFVGIGENSPAYSLQLGTDNGSTPLFYIKNAGAAPTPPAAPNDGIFSVFLGKPLFTSGTSQYQGAITTANTTGSAATCGQATLNGTTGVTISTTAVTTSTIVLVTHSTGTGAPTLLNIGELVVGSIVAATSFTIYSTVAADTAAVNWFIINP